MTGRRRSVGDSKSTARALGLCPRPSRGFLFCSSQPSPNARPLAALKVLRSSVALFSHPLLRPREVLRSSLSASCPSSRTPPPPCRQTSIPSPPTRPAPRTPPAPTSSTRSRPPPPPSSTRPSSSPPSPPSRTPRPPTPTPTRPRASPSRPSRTARPRQNKMAPPSSSPRSPRPPSSPSSTRTSPPDASASCTACSRLSRLLERPENHHMIRWDPAGEHIIVERPEQLALHVLPSVYRQSRFASFSRQLNVRTCSLVSRLPRRR